MYTITYTIQLHADSPLEAAKSAHQYIRESAGPVFDVEEENTVRRWRVDLSEADEDAVTPLNHSL